MTLGDIEILNKGYCVLIVLNMITNHVLLYHVYSRDVSSQGLSFVLDIMLKMYFVYTCSLQFV